MFTDADRIISHFCAITLLAFLLCVEVITAQQAPINTNIFFKNFGEDDGLPNATINCFEEDDQGFIWIGTLNGLAKFNGEEFVSFNTSDDSTSLHNDEINELFYLDKEMWIGTANGLAVMDIEDETFTTYQLPELDQYSNTIESLLKIGDTLWIGYESNGSLKGALALFSLTKRTFVDISSDHQELDNVHDIYLDPHDPNIIWIASSDLFKTDPQLSYIEAQHFPISFAASRRGVTEILSLAHDKLLVSSTKGLFEYQHKEQSWSEILKYNHGESQSVFSPNYVKAMERQSEDVILLNTYDLGLVMFDTNDLSFLKFNVSDQDPFAIPSYRSHTSFLDSKSRIWNGFYSSMNVVLEESQIVSLDSYDPIGTNSIPIITQNGMECMIDGKHFAYSKDVNKPRRINSPFKENWLYAEEGSNGDKYYLFSDALYRLSKGSSVYERVVHKSIFQDGEENRRWFKFFSIDETQRVWISTELGNVVIYDPDSIAKLIGIKDNKIGICQSAPEASYRIAHGDHETIIAHACGLLIFDESQQVLIDINDQFKFSLWDSTLWSYGISYIGENKYVIGTFRQGLFELDIANQQVKNISPQLENIIISNITSNGKGEAWCATDEGLIYYDSHKENSILITKKEGLPQEYLIFQKLYYDQDGKAKMLLPGQVIEIDKSKLFNKGSDHVPVITTIKIDNQELYKNLYLSTDTIIELDHHQNNIEISYGQSTNFSNIPTKYHYKMDGLNENWVDAKQTSTARFFELDPGHYTFKLSRSALPPDDHKFSSVHIIINGPIWNTWWFRILAFLMVLSGILMTYRNRINQVKNRMRLEHEENQNSLLKSQNEIIQEQNKELLRLNQSKDKFFSVLAHDLRAPLSAFSGLGKQMNYHIERKNLKKVTMLSGHIQDSAENLTTLVDNLLNWSLVQNGKIAYEPEDLSVGEIIATIRGQLRDVYETKRIQIETAISPHAIIFADSQAVHIVLRNIISNAIKFSHLDSSIFISTELCKNVTIKIEDHGVGISEDNLEKINYHDAVVSLGTMGEKGVGLGIELCKELLDMNHATMHIESKENNGTVVILQFPKSK